MNLFKKAFMATGKGYDITHFNFNHFGLIKLEFKDSKGDIIKNEFYKTYDSVNDIYSDLAIKEERTYTRDNVTGLPQTRSTNITWYATDGSILHQETGQMKYYSPEKGFRANKRARQNLLEKASLYFYQALLTNASGDRDAADISKNEFDAWTTAEQSQYMNSTVSPLVTKIKNAGDLNHADTRAYMTAAMAATMETILDVNYDGTI